MISLALALLLTVDPDPDAVRLTRKATVEYNAGEFGQAFLDYQAAYDLEAIPELIFDMGQCQRGLHHWERADFLYKRYLSERPQARNRAKVAILIAQVEQRLQEERAAAHPDPAEAPLALQPTATLAATPQTALAQKAAPPASPSTPRAIPAGAWVTGGLGAACLLGAGGLGLAVLLQPDPVTVQNGVPVHTLTYAHLQTINAEGTAGIALAVGGALLVGAALLWGAAAQ